LNRGAVSLEGVRGVGLKQVAVKYDFKKSTSQKHFSKSMSCLNPTPKSFKQGYNRIENIDWHENSIPNIAIMIFSKEPLAPWSPLIEQSSHHDFFYSKPPKILYSFSLQSKNGVVGH
jgi:hypothetical protein